ncbi:MAG: tRNA pseudouridine(13) synthase TruD [Thermoprotei archaeon]
MSWRVLPKIPGCVGWEGCGVEVAIGAEPEDFRVCEIHVSGEDACSAKPSERVGNLAFGVIRKRGITTLDAVRKLARSLRCSSHEIHVGGLKDRHAVTSQFATLPGHATDIDLGDVAFTRLSKRFTPYSAKEVWGNWFRIRIRADPGVKKAADMAFDFSSQPIPSYYGHQRFGSLVQDTHLVGLAILRRDYHQAVETILSGPSGWYENDLAENLRRGMDEPSALGAVDRRLLRLFVNSYQSYVFNRMLSALIREHGSVEKIPFRYVGVADRYGVLSKASPASAVANLQHKIIHRQAYPLLELPGSRVHSDSPCIALIAEDGLSREHFEKTLAGEFHGGYRQMFFYVQGLQTTASEVSEASEASATLSFALTKGMYATVAASAFVASARRMHSG